MLFNSFDFLFFFIFVLSLYYLFPHRFRWALLLTASYYFYACWRVEYLALILFSTTIDYWAGLRMGRLEEKIKRKKYLLVSIITNLSLLFIFKYFNFVNENLRDFFNYFNIFYGVPAYEILLPIGISFYTFQSMSYSIDVYRGKREPERHLGIFALYVSFFPQLVIGPIERSTRLLPQFYKEKSFNWEQFKLGMLMILLGLFKKTVIADRLAIFVARVFDNPDSVNGLPVLIGAYMFAYQLYCDFSGYSDIAVGVALTMGYHLTQNFNRPFAAPSVREFWQRWHISLTSWITDYVYLPFARTGERKFYKRSVMLFIFLLFGLWHGANWTFVIFGLLIGSVILISDLTFHWRRAVKKRFFALCGAPPVKGEMANHWAFRVHYLFQVFIVYNIIAFSGFFFRADSISDSFTLISNIAVNLNLRGLVGGVGDAYELIIAMVAICLLELGQWLNDRHNLPSVLFQWPIWWRWPVYYILIFSVLIFGEFNLKPFVYFQF